MSFTNTLKYISTVTLGKFEKSLSTLNKELDLAMIFRHYCRLDLGCSSKELWRLVEARPVTYNMSQVLLSPIV